MRSEVVGMVKELKLYVPDEVYKRIEKIENELGISKQDLILRALVKVIEEFEKMK